ncbi:carboxy-S-adenosyl-L-methionine synthase CmoA [Sessilibacter corallicola]|uniref:carboxy-S-adenosyl-L-methionine synthase CmoA n=1 Tax=Sessilibacter corallicola TaxID=2904075 RepID=UPI001E2AA88B|nr:carboxy-S-adenosyl-L-methionine synthase CmoA [Sessilibacter corallicola]MCE2028961.1 carboxy-S-adenosyl-L-methionine synthase CmoA [Sessilibacter corallicola]
MANPNEPRDSQTSREDNLFATPLEDIQRFSFNKAVVDVFPDMIKRSVPGYTTIIGMIGDFARRYAREETKCYDLGCSLGAATLSIRHNISVDNCEIVAIDNSQAMIDQAKKLIDRDNSPTPITLLCDDINSIEINNASIVVLNFTLQFIPIAVREALMEKIYNGLIPGGVLILSEKVAFEDPSHNQLMINLYHDFKRANGYSDLEISQKRESLENVLIPETLTTHKNRLKKVGFSDADVWFQCFNFASMIAQKSL